MEIVNYLEIILSILCLLAVIAIIIFFTRKRKEDINFEELIKNENILMQKNIDLLNEGNKIINDIEEKILTCKKKLNIKSFK